MDWSIVKGYSKRFFDMPDSLESLFVELIDQQKDKLYKMGCEFVPHLTKDDLMQPNDFPALELNPLFRYEEGILEGLYTAKMACLHSVSIP